MALHSLRILVWQMDGTVAFARCHMSVVLKSIWTTLSRLPTMSARQP